ncbi:ATP-binding cassette domain-containing protein [Spirosoma sordidisoli]|uniref:ATP-binding cassette domain-containing protein n=1 Tax=Spirosoma sordidisoli TaxID=2502893 RepID=A0A4Q2UEK7_9BACT|nr:ATP-binding cassette domain-containing protein [Spirosoma sordidisoli]RYC67597.1 ATP-binding cassette domain-containing protein [Spirosoma sordidisoli]
MNQSDPLITLDQRSLPDNSRSSAVYSLFQLHAGQCWAVVGATGSGKTLFLQTLAGQVPRLAGRLVRRQSVAYVSFREESRLFSYSGHFYQQRYQATMSDEGSRGQAAPTLRDYLQLADPAAARPLLDRLGLSPLLDRTFLKLSNGQSRKARIGKALLQQPAVLLLDNPFVGLDAAFRQELTQWLAELTQHGLTLVLATDADSIPPFVTHVVELGGSQIQWAGPIQAYRPTARPSQQTALPIWQTSALPADFGEAFRLSEVTVRYGDQLILDRVSWTVRPGERWALLGPNGAGKSVLLSLLYGDHPQAYANLIHVFDHRRGRPGQSIWDVKRRIGFVSPELHLYFPQQLTARQVVLTGLTDTLTIPRQASADTQADLLAMLRYFGLSEKADKPFGQLSAGEQRLVLLVRALIKNPPVLILDEPFQAIDAARVELARRLLDGLPDKTILFVTHDRRDLPDTVDRTFDISTEAPR